MHAHVSYLTEECPACLLMLTVERDAFFELSAAKQKIVAVRKMIETYNQIVHINKGVRQKNLYQGSYVFRDHYLILHYVAGSRKSWGT